MRQSRMQVSAIVLPAARLDVQSATALTVRVTMYPNAQALVWTASGSCGAPDRSKVIQSSGIHQLAFSFEEVAGKDRVCLASSDGVLHTSALLPH